MFREEDEPDFERAVEPPGFVDVNVSDVVSQELNPAELDQTYEVLGNLDEREKIPAAEEWPGPKKQLK